MLHAQEDTIKTHIIIEIEFFKETFYKLLKKIGFYRSSHQWKNIDTSATSFCTEGESTS